MISLPDDAMHEAAVAVCRQLRLSGYEAFFAGGCVRDALLGRVPKDYDIATNAAPGNVRRIFDRTVLVGEQFGVVRVQHGGFEFEVATFRSDGTYTDGRRPDFVNYGSLEEDVRRRDFTINAMMLDPLTGVIIDLVGGQADLARGVIRAVGDPVQRFAEDRLRMLRAIRFACQLEYPDGLEFNVEPATFRAIHGAASGLLSVSRERVTEELAKIWRSDPGDGWRMLWNSGLLPHALPYVGENWRRGGAMDRLTGDREHPVILPTREKEAIAWAISLHNVPLGDADEEMREHLRLSNDMMRRVTSLLLARDDLSQLNVAKTARGVRILLKPDVGMYLTYQVCLIGWPEHPAKTEYQAIFEELKDNPLPLDAIPRGDDFLVRGITGSRLGKGLRAAEEAVLERRARSKEEAMDIALKEIADEA